MMGWATGCYIYIFPSKFWMASPTHQAQTPRFMQWSPFLPNYLGLNNCEMVLQLGSGEIIY